MNPEQPTLVEGKNGVTVAGTLKSKHFKYGTNKNGVPTINGNIVIEFKNGDKINNVRMDAYVAQFTSTGKQNSFYQGMDTVAKTFKDSDTYGAEAYKVVADGDISFNAYKGSNGVVRQSNRVRVSTISQLPADNTEIQEGAFGQVTAYVAGYQEETDSEGVQTDMLDVEAYYVGYQGRVNKFIDLKVPSAMGMQNAVPEGSKLDLSFMINQYAVVKQQQSQGGFGTFHQVVDTTSWTRNLEIVGGDSDHLEMAEPGVIEAEQANIRQQLTDAQNATNQPVQQHVSSAVNGFVNQNGNGLTNQLNQASAGAQQQFAQGGYAGQQAPAQSQNGIHEATDPFAQNATVQMPGAF